MKLEEAALIIDAFVRYGYNVSLDEFRRLFPDANDDYVIEKFKLMQKDVGAFWGQLDGAHRELLLPLIAERYNGKNDPPHVVME